MTDERIYAVAVNVKRPAAVPAAEMNDRTRGPDVLSPTLVCAERTIGGDGLASAIRMTP
jgi:hypothetical protein